MNSLETEKLRVLVVDDDEMNRRMMRLILSREDHYVQLASDGFEACEAAKNGQFDIILMDLQMPKMDGVETSRRIRSMEIDGRQAYIVALTASYLPEKGNELFDAGIDNYIAKPFEVEHLRQMLKHGLDHRRNKIELQLKKTQPELNGVDPVFNPEIGIKRVGGDESAFRDLLSDFVRELPQKIDNMVKCLEREDFDGLSRNAHNFKGVSANLGVLQLSQYAGRLENSAGEGYTESLRLNLKELKSLSEQFINDATSFLAENENN